MECNSVAKLPKTNYWAAKRMHQFTAKFFWNRSISALRGWSVTITFVTLKNTNNIYKIQMVITTNRH